MPIPLAANALARPIPIVLWCRVCGFFDMIVGAVCSWNGAGAGACDSEPEGRRQDLRFFTSWSPAPAGARVARLVVSRSETAEADRARAWPAESWLSDLGDSTICMGW